jgi:hypothetical protein
MFVNKQLPPTSFFDRVIADEEDADWDNISDAVFGLAAKATELESILALCEARGIKSAMLRWHYRSRHPSLIEVSNAEFYKRLIMPPAPVLERGREGLILQRVAGAYDRGGKRNTLVEAESARPHHLPHAGALSSSRSRCAPPPHRGQISIAQKPPFGKGLIRTPIPYSTLSSPNRISAVTASRRM